MSALPVMYDAVHCTREDAVRLSHIGDCRTEPANGRCPATPAAAAAVACTHVPHREPPRKLRIYFCIVH